MHFIVDETWEMDRITAIDEGGVFFYTTTHLNRQEQKETPILTTTTNAAQIVNISLVHQQTKKENKMNVCESINVVCPHKWTANMDYSNGNKSQKSDHISTQRYNSANAKEPCLVWVGVGCISNNNIRI